MPELAEVEFYRRRWAVGHGDRVLAVETHSHARIFREAAATALQRELSGAVLVSSEARAKQMLFRFRGGKWLGVHLGMSGELHVEPCDYATGKHDHFILRQARRTLVFSDPRMFGQVRLHSGQTAPNWWTSIAPGLLTPAFTTEAVAGFLRRRARTPLKAALLMQARFPGIGNWMADEILWRAALHPRRTAGSLSAVEVRRLHRECQCVCTLALKKIAGVGGALPSDLNVGIPKTWLFWHRWEDGGRCPRSGAPLQREEIGGRTTCWSPARQKLTAV